MKATRTLLLVILLLIVYIPGCIARIKYMEGMYTDYAPRQALIGTLLNHIDQMAAGDLVVSAFLTMSSCLFPCVINRLSATPVLDILEPVYACKINGEVFGLQSTDTRIDFGRVRHPSRSQTRDYAQSLEEYLTLLLALGLSPKPLRYPVLKLVEKPSGPTSLEQIQHHVLSCSDTDPVSLARIKKVVHSFSRRHELQLELIFLFRQLRAPNTSGCEQSILEIPRLVTALWSAPWVAPRGYKWPRLTTENDTPHNFRIRVSSQMEYNSLNKSPQAHAGLTHRVYKFLYPGANPVYEESQLSCSPEVAISLDNPGLITLHD